MLDVFEIVNWLRVKKYDDLKQGKSHKELTQLRTMKLLYYMQAADQSTEITKKNIRDAYLDKFNDKDWNPIKIVTKSNPDSLRYTVAKEKLEERGLLPSPIHDVKDEDAIWNQFA